MLLRGFLRRVVVSAPLLGALSGAAVASAIVLTSDEAIAKTSVESRYGFERTWNAALRLVRIDLGFKITEKDDTTGYLMFEYTSSESGNKSSSGSFEFIRGKDADTPVKVVIQLPQMPRYHEQVMIDSLSRKLRQEYGDPPAKKPPPAPAAPPDAGVASPDDYPHAQ